MSSPPAEFDVAIVGSGLGGSTLAAILARHGHRVLLLEAQSHPRFAVGESVVPEFGARAKLLAIAHDVPELAAMRNFQHLRQRISVNSGIKRNFSFLHHQPGQVHRAAQSSQFEAMPPPLGPDSHIWRADLDAWLTAVAVRYGTVFRDRCPVDAVEIASDGVAIRSGASRFRARFLVDGSGHRSALAQTLGLRIEPDQKTDTRCLFTHMVGVRSIHESRPGTDPLRLPSSPDQGTLHHLFHGGWFWVIPFGNHSNAINPVCSVGLTLDRRLHPDSDLPAEEEFAAIAERFPTVAAQFQGARAVRAWVKTGRLQYRSSHLAGARWCLLPHAANFVDALFSGGMPLTLLGVHQVASVLLQTLRDGDFDAQRFRGIEQESRENLRIQDTLVHSGFLSFRSHELFDAWYRIWALGNYHGPLGLYRLALGHRGAADRDFLERLDSPLYRRVMGMGLPRMRALLDRGLEILEHMEAGGADEEQTVDELFRTLGAVDWVPPQFHLATRGRNHLTSFTILPMMALILWGKRNAPEDMRDAFYGFDSAYFRELMGSFGREGARGLASFWHVFRQAHVSGGKA